MALPGLSINMQGCMDFRGLLNTLYMFVTGVRYMQPPPGFVLLEVRRAYCTFLGHDVVSNSGTGVAS